MPPDAPASRKPTTSLPEVTILFAGDSGDGMQLTGGQFTLATARARNDLATLPDFPAEIRAPAGTTLRRLRLPAPLRLRTRSRTPGDEVDLLVAMNPAALKVNLNRVREGGAVLVNLNAFDDRGLELAGYDANPLDDGTLDRLRGLPRRADPADARGPRRHGALDEADRPVEEHVRARARAVALHPAHRGDRRVDRGQVRRRPGDPRRQPPRRSTKGVPLRRDDGGLRRRATTWPRRACRPAPTAASAGNEALALGLVAAGGAERARTLLRLVPDHARLATSSTRSRSTRTSAC